MDNVLLFGATLFTGLIAGLFFGWVVSVNPGLKRVADDTYIETMQRINVAIVNPVFLLLFMGTPVLLVAAAIANTSTSATWLWASAGTYVVGVFGVTVGRNVPLNNALEEFDLAAASPRSMLERRHSYEIPWVRWHNVRTGANLVALAFAIAAGIV